MKTVTVNIPDEMNEKELKMAIAAIFFDKGIFSSGQAADFAGITKREFIENAGNYGVSVFGESVEDLKKDLFDR